MATMTNMFALLGDGDDDSVAPPAAAAPDTKASKKDDKPKAPAKAGIKADDSKVAKGSANSKGGGKGRGGKDGGKDGGKGSRGGYDRAPREDEDGDNYGRGKGGRGGKGGYGKGGRGGGYGEGEDGRRGKREYDRRSGTGKGGEVKRGGAGKANWGSEKDEIKAANKEDGDDANGEDKKSDEAEPEIDPEVLAEREREANEMTLPEYAKVLAEKKAALNSFNKDTSSSRTVDKKEFSKLVLVEKSEETDFFSGPVKEKKGKKKTSGDNDEGETKFETNFSYPKQEYTPRDSGKGGKGGKGGRGRKGRDGGGGGGGGGGDGGNTRGYGGRGYSAPNITDDSAFPTLG